MIPFPMQSIIAVLAICLISTIAIECAVAAAAFRIRNPSELAIIALAQVVTNPIVVVASTLAGSALPFPAARWAALIALEAGAATAEALLYRKAGVSKRPWRLSAVCNVASFLIGLAAQSV